MKVNESFGNFKIKFNFSSNYELGLFFVVTSRLFRFGATGSL